MSVKKLIKS